MKTLYHMGCFLIGLAAGVAFGYTVTTIALTLYELLV